MARPGERPVTRERVLDAAERLFLTRGYLSVTIDEIATKAGYTRGAVYSNFSDKEEIMFALHDRRTAREDVQTLAAISNVTTDTGALEAFGRAFAREVERAREWGRSEMEFLAVAANRPDLVERIVAQQRQTRREFAEFLVDMCGRLGVEAPEDLEGFTLAVIALQRGLMIEWMVDPAVDIGRVFANAFAQLLRANTADAIQATPDDQDHPGQAASAESRS